MTSSLRLSHDVFPVPGPLAGIPFGCSLTLNDTAVVLETTCGSVRVCEDCTGVAREPTHCGLCDSSAPGVPLDAASVTDSWFIRDCDNESLGVCSPPVTSTLAFVVDAGLIASELASLATVIARTLSSLDETVQVLMLVVSDRCLRLYALDDPSSASCRCFPVQSSSKPYDLTKCNAAYCQPPVVAREAIATVFETLSACSTRNHATSQSIQAALDLCNSIVSDTLDKSCTIVLCVTGVEVVPVAKAATVVDHATPSLLSRVSGWISSVLSPSKPVSYPSKYIGFETRTARMCVHAVVSEFSCESPMLPALQHLTKTSGGQLHSLSSLCDSQHLLLLPFPHGSAVRIVVSRPLIVTRFLGRLISGDCWQLPQYCWSTISPCDKYRSYDIIVPCNNVSDGIVLELDWEYGATVNHGGAVSIQVHRSVRSQVTLAQHCHIAQCVTVPISSNCDVVLSTLDCEVVVGLLVKSIVAGILSSEAPASCTVIEAACRGIQKCLRFGARLPVESPLSIRVNDGILRPLYHLIQLITLLPMGSNRAAVLSSLQFANHELCHRSLCPIVYTIMRMDESTQLQPVSYSSWTSLVPPVVIDFSVCVVTVTDSIADFDDVRALLARQTRPCPVVTVSVSLEMWETSIKTKESFESFVLRCLV